MFNMLSDAEVSELNHAFLEKEELERQNRLIISDPLIQDVINSLISSYVVLNGQRQIVAYNNSLKRSFGINGDTSIIGKRLGEIVRCIHADEDENGCGSTEYCRACGAMQSITKGLKGIECINECRIIRIEKGETLSLLVNATPYRINGEKFVLLDIVDNSAAKKQDILERVFYHDILNIATVIKLSSEVLADPRSVLTDEIRSSIGKLADNLIDIVQTQQTVAAAEKGWLFTKYKKVASTDVIYNALDIIRSEASLRNIHLECYAPVDYIEFETEPMLLNRVLNNMLKNALEASSDSDVVTIGCQHTNDEILFFVHNSACMEMEVQLQLFQKSFSTKGDGRGMGTYSMKLFTEKYLNGRLFFISTEKEGTTFTIALPI